MDSLFDDPVGPGDSLFDHPSFDDGPPVPPRVKLVWNEDQVRAVDDILRWRRDPSAPRYLKLTGPAGSGKTAVTLELRRRLSGTRTAWSAMTGKAALRLRDALDLRDVKTFHSALYHLPREVDCVEEQRIDLRFDAVKSGDVDDTLLVVDEASMISPKLRADMDRSPYVKALLIGDEFQLSPVLTRQEEFQIGGDDYSVFAGLPGPHLTKVMRNGGAVLRAATVVREEQRVPTESQEEGGSIYDYAEVRQESDAIMGAVEAYLGDREGHVLLTWTNANRNLLNAIIRHRLGHAPGLPSVGERLVVRKNTYKKGLMNGDVVRCEEVRGEGPTLAGISTRWFLVSEEVSGRAIEVLAPSGDFTGVLPYVGLDVWNKALREVKVDVIPLTYAYCLTIHLAQGSGYRRVTIVSPGDFRSAHYNKMTRLPDGTPMPFSMRHIYTGISRAMKHASFIVSS